MKRIYYLFFSLIFFAGCKTDELKLYSADNYLYFEQPSEESIIYSFSFHPGVDFDTIPLVVKLIGDASPKDRVMNLTVDAANTSALADEYTLPEQVLFRAGLYRDTIPLVIHKTARLTQARATLRLVLNNCPDFKCGPNGNLYVDVQFSDQLSRPVWWNANVESNYLGTYSDTKYRLFIQATGAVDLSESSPSEMRAYALIFRDFLLKAKDAGTPYSDENGLISVPVRLFG